MLQLFVIGFCDMRLEQVWPPLESIKMHFLQANNVLLQLSIE